MPYLRMVNLLMHKYKFLNASVASETRDITLHSVYVCTFSNIPIINTLYLYQCIKNDPNVTAIWESTNLFYTVAQNYEQILLQTQFVTPKRLT